MEFVCFSLAFNFFVKCCTLGHLIFAAVVNACKCSAHSHTPCKVRRVASDWIDHGAWPVCMCSCIGKVLPRTSSLYTDWHIWIYLQDSWQAARMHKVIYWALCMCVGGSPCDPITWWVNVTLRKLCIHKYISQFTIWVQFLVWLVTSHWCSLTCLPTGSCSTKHSSP